MTPFGIRKRIKKLLDSPSAGPTVPDVPRFTVSFETASGKSFSVDAKQGDSLALASGRGAYPIATGCADSSCGTCRVGILEGADSLTPANPHELRTKKLNKVPAHMRLGCQAGVIGEGVKVKIIHVFGEDIA